MFDNAYSYWTILATVYLAYLVYQDLKHDRMVDDRKNYFMFGLTVSLLSHVTINFWYLGGLIIIITLLGFFLKKFDLVGGADINSFIWIFFGIGIINIFKLVWFLIFMMVVTLAYYFINRFIARNKKDPVPYYPVIVSSFVLNAWLMELY